MDQSTSEMKQCKLCKQQLPVGLFHRCGDRKYSSRCKRCHTLAYRRCHVCFRIFIGKHGRKACSRLCHDLMCPQTYLICKHCNKVFGPVDKLRQKYCSKPCSNAGKTTGRKKLRKTITKARSAQSLLRYHIQAGHIVRPTTCEECGCTDRKIEGAHFNYDEPLRVRWLCVSCHRRWDKREPKNATFVVTRNVSKELPAPEIHNPSTKCESISSTNCSIYDN